MKATARSLGHPIHPMLIVFPLGLLPVASIFDIVFLYTHNGHWADISFWLIAAGVIGGLLAAVFGLIDWIGIPSGTRAKSIGLVHGLTNVVLVVLFLVSWVMRRPNPAAPEMLAIILGFVAVGLSFLSGWLGGELVYRMNVAVDEGAHADSPSSLSGRPASEKAGGPRSI
jgi:uncharacterized membrane protein